MERERAAVERMEALVDAPPDTDDEWSTSDEEPASQKPGVEDNAFDAHVRLVVEAAEATEAVAALSPVSGLPSAILFEYYTNTQSDYSKNKSVRHAA